MRNFTFWRDKEALGKNALNASKEAVLLVCLNLNHWRAFCCEKFFFFPHIKGSLRVGRTRVSPLAERFETSRGKVCWRCGTNQC